MFFAKPLIKMNSSFTSFASTRFPPHGRDKQRKEALMYKFKNSLIAFGGLLLLISAIAFATPHSTQGQREEPVGPTKPVEVVNTPAEPVPVTGTITGSVNVANTPNVNVVNAPTVDARQSGQWNVGIAGTPTVRIDPNSNTVQFAPRDTELLLDSGQIQPLGSGAIHFPVEVGSISKVRVYGINLCGSEVTFRTDALLPGGTVIQLDDFKEASGGRFTQIYDTLGATLRLTVFPSPACAQASGYVQLWVYGN